MNWGRVILVLLVFVPFAFSFTDIPVYMLDAKYEILENNSVKTILNFTLSPSVNRSLIYETGHNISKVNVTDSKEDLQFKVIKENLNYMLNISINESRNKIIISYYSNDYIFSKEDINLFTTDFHFLKPVQKLKVKVIFPGNSKIYNSDYVPADAIVSTDGEKIILTWKDSSIINSNSFSVKYQVNQYENKTIVIEKKKLEKVSYASIGLALLLLAILVLSYLKFKTRISSVFLTGFFEDEQKTINFLREKKTVWQSQITKEFGFSRAKTTRIIAKLEQKNLIRKEPYGRTNKIHWL